MSLRIRRGTDAQRTSITFDLGELVWTTDSQKLYVGDGITAGGINALATMAGSGFAFNTTTQRIDFSVPNLNLNTSEVAENSANLYFTDARAQAAAADALLAGNSYNTGIAFSWDSVDGRITAVATGNQVPSITGNAGKYLTTDGTNIIWHNPPIPGGLSIPSFSGNQGKYLTTDGTNLAWANIAINTLTYNTYNVILDSSGNLTTSGSIKLPYGKDILRDNGSGTFVSITGGLLSVSNDSSPSLGGNLGLNGHNITGTGNINFTGNLQASGTLQAGNSTLNSLIVSSSLSAGITTVTTLNVTTGLSANLPLNNFNINGTGNININGQVSATTINTNTLTGISNGSITATSTNQTPFQITSYGAGTLQSGSLPSFSLNSSKGTVGRPVNTIPGDYLHNINFTGYYNGSYISSGSIVSNWDGTADLTANNPASTLSFATGANNGAGLTGTSSGRNNGYNLMTFNSQGILTAPVVNTEVFSGTTLPTVLPDPAAVGMGARAFVSDATSNTFAATYVAGGSYKVPVYSDGTAWYIG